MSIRNRILVDIVTANDGTVTDPNNRNQLLRDWLLAVGGGLTTRLVADLNGLSQYISIPTVTISRGESVSLVYAKKDTVAGNSEQVLISSDSANSMVIIRDSGHSNPNSVIVRTQGLSDQLFQNAVTEADGEDVSFMLDITNTGLTLTINERVTNRSSTTNDLFSFSRIGRRGGTSVYFNSILRDVKVNDGSTYNYPINDGFTNDPVIANAADLSGLTDGTAINFTEATWVEVSV